MKLKFWGLAPSPCTCSTTTLGAVQ